MSTNKGKPFLANIEPYIAAGVDPKTGLPIKMVMSSNIGTNKEAIKATLRILDEQNAVTRYQWYNLPCNISSQELERLLYYKGQLAFFYCEPLKQFFFMPYALDGTIDFYGRFNRIHPVPMAEGNTNEEKANYAKQRQYLSTLKLNVLYDFPDEITYDTIKNSCVLLHDYTKQLSQTIISRQILQDPILDVMADCIPFMHTALMNSTGVQAMRVNSQDEYSNVIAANASINQAALNGQKYIPVVGNIDFQDLAGGNVAKSEEFLMAMQSLDNFRLSLYGLDNGGLFQKKSHMLEAEQKMNSGVSKSALTDGLQIRQRFCDIVNNVYGLGISCELSETALGVDTNGDLVADDSKDQSGMVQGEQPGGTVNDVE